MIIFWLALVVSSALTICIGFCVQINGFWDIYWLIVFFIASIFVCVEIFKWPLGKKRLDNSKKPVWKFFGDPEDAHWLGRSWFLRASIISARKGKEAWQVWYQFCFGLFFLTYSLYLLLSV